MKKLLAIALSATMLLSTASAALGAYAAQDEARAASAANTNELRLWYDKPATEGKTILGSSASDADNIWQQYTLPIGNGHIGANVYGEVASEHLTFNEQTLWIGGPSASRPNYIGGNLPSKGQSGASMRLIQDLLAQGKNVEAKAKCEELLVGDTNGYGSYQAWGDIYFDFGFVRANAQNYVRDLDMKTAVASVDFDYNATAYHREYLTSHPDNVMAVRFTADGSGTLDFDVRFPFKGTNAAAVASGDTLTLSGQLSDNQMKYYSQLKVVPVGGGTVTAGSGKLTVAGAKTVDIYIAANTDYKNEYPAYRTGESIDDLKAAVTGRINAAAAKGYDKVKADHVADYQSLFNRVDLDLGQEASQKTTDILLEAYKKGTASDAEDKNLEVMLFQYGRYLTISSSREDSQLPANLQGLWNNRVVNVPWSSDFHMNVNLQMNYWPTYVTNLAQCAIPLQNYVDSLREPGRVTAEIYMGVESDAENPENGFTANTQNTPFGWTCPGNQFWWGWSPAAVPWILQNCYEYYEYTGDVDYLREMIYPMLREAARLYDQILIWDEKSQRMVSSPSYSPEHGPYTVGNTYEQTLIWQLYEDASTAAEVLGVDADMVSTWKDTQSKLDPIHIGDGGQLKEWYEETTLGSLGDQGHRHMSHLLGLFPGDLISVETPEWLEAAIVSLKDRGMTSTGWGMGQRINTWARTGDAEKSYEAIRTLFPGNGSGGIYPNLWDAHPPFQIDGNFGMTSGVAEMLLQSNQGYVNLLPALPNAWANGNVSGLVARGNFEISMDWSGKHANRVEILSNNGGECVVDYPLLSLGSITKADGTPVEVTTISADRVSFESEKNETYVITKIPKSGEQISAPGGLNATRIDDANVDLIWNAVEGDDVSYQVYRQIGSGEFRLIASDVKTTSYADGKADQVLGVLSYKVAAVVDGIKGKLSDAVGVTDPRGINWIDDRNPGITYSTGWGTWDDASHHKGTIHFFEQSTGGESITYSFEGSGIKVISPKNPNFGYMNVFIDDMETPVATNVDFYAASSLKKQETYVNMDLAPGIHTIKLVATGTKNPASTKTKLEFDAFVVYNGENGAVKDITVGTKTGASTIGAATGTMQMTAVVTPDNAAIRDVAWSVSDESVATIDQNGLLTAKGKVGTVTVTAAAKDASGVKGTKVISVKLPGAEQTTIYDDNDAGTPIKFSSNWNLWDQDNRNYNSTIHYSEGANSVGQTVEFTFQGAGIEVYTTKNATFGGFKVYIDDMANAIETIDLNSTAPQGEAQQKIFEKKDLANGTHTIKLEIVEMRGKSKAEFDYFKVFAPGGEADKAALQAQMQRVDPLISTRYEEASWNNLTAALAAAVAVMDNNDATAEQISAQVAALETAIDALTEQEDTQAPTAPGSLTVIGVEDTSLMLKWAASTDNIGVTGYQIYNGSTKLGTVNDLYYRVSGLQASTEYTFTVKAVDAAGNLSDAATLKVTTDAAPDTENPVMGTVSVGNITNTSAQVTWTAATDNLGITGYEVYLNSTMVGKTTSTSYDITGLDKDKAYTVKVRAYDAAGNFSVPVGKTFTTTGGSVEEPKAAISGVVNDNAGNPVAGATVTLAAAARALPMTTTTNEKGEYTFTGVPYGSYSITVEKEGFETKTFTVNASSETVVSPPADLTPEAKPDTPNTKELQKVIDAAARMKEKFDLYVEAGKADFETALTEAKAALTASTQGAVDAAKQKLLNAMDALRYKADKSTLEEFLKELSDIDLSIYTIESANEFRVALAEAQELLKQDLSVEQQELLIRMQEKLQKAQDNLVLEEEPNPSSKPDDNDSSSDTPSDDNSSNVSSDNENTDNPDSSKTQPGSSTTTGDNSNMMLYIVIGVVAVALIVVAVLVIRKRSNREE